MKLSEARVQFSILIARLVLWGNDQTTYQVALGRDFDEDNEPLRHMKGSLHYLGLATDLALYVNGVYQKTTEAYKRLGEIWKAMDPNCAWGGDFQDKDGNHFSYMWGGKK